MFDYNEMLMQACAKALTGVNYHTEIWEDYKSGQARTAKEYESFLFTNWYNYNKTHPDLNTGLP